MRQYLLDRLCRLIRCFKIGFEAYPYEFILFIPVNEKKLTVIRPYINGAVIIGNDAISCKLAGKVHGLPVQSIIKQDSACPGNEYSPFPVLGNGVCVRTSIIIFWEIILNKVLTFLRVKGYSGQE